MVLIVLLYLLLGLWFYNHIINNQEGFYLINPPLQFTLVPMITIIIKFMNVQAQIIIIQSYFHIKIRDPGI